ncbi:phosphoribosyltransferase [Paludisphaera rhizosphaerae]|uniref:phosphoribosyltransferase n=1 Tax=Paludisphaera rhizosphaerae TaxID=2711216 RepID=UPI0013EC6263|nr:phosphoribosyltransferase [Paludisphaera rhizosphaerae]
MSRQVFRDRREAGRVLAESLSKYAGRSDVLVLGLPRGGVPVAYEAAHALGAPLDVFLVRKLGVPGHEELAFGALASGGVRLLNRDVVEALRIQPQVVEAVTKMEATELGRRERQYRDDRPAPEVRDRTVILIDDGLATGASMRAAVAALKRMGPARVVVAVPVAARQTVDEMSHEVDEIVCARTPEPFQAVGLWYADFSQTSDAEVSELLRQAEREQEAARTASR